MGSRLPSEQEVLIIRPTGKRVGRLCLRQATHGLPGALPGTRHSKAGSEKAVQAECSSSED
jgi:hypothetical protein